MSVAVKYPYSYRAFNLDIVSQFPVSGFESVKAHKPDVIIRKGDVPETLSNPINQGILFQSSGAEFILKIENVARYHVREGREIIINPIKSDVRTGEVSAFINGSLFGALLHQRRMLPLHASTVIYNDQCMVFAGLSGSGKSTLAASLMDYKATLLADDISVIDFADDKPIVFPAFPAIKLWEDSIHHLGLQVKGLVPVRKELRKFYLPVEQFSHKPSSISHVFILNTHNQFDFDIKELRGIDKFTVLKKHTYLFRGIPNTGLEKNHFMLVNKLAMNVPISLITRPNAEFDTAKLIEKISKHISKA